VTARGFSLALRLACTAPALLACGGGDPTGTGVAAGATLNLTLRALPPLDAATRGRYEAWVLDRQGAAHPLGVVTPAGAASVALTTPVDNPVSFLITYEPGSGAAATPSEHRLLAGQFRNARATLSVEGALTPQGLPLREHPGQFTMFSPSDNHRNGYPSHEDAGIWLFNMAPRETPQNDMWVRLTPLQPGWVYEGWMVRDIDTPGAVWLSYGKFLPDATGAVNSRDDTGWGEFSGVVDYLNGEEEFPGDDWISNPLGYPVPGSLTLPLNLREKTSSGVSRWTHVITIEPSSDKGEPVTTPRPFVVGPYRDPFGDGGPGVPRTITFHAGSVPSGEVALR
jgi:hypothetical protein